MLPGYVTRKKAKCIDYSRRTGRDQDVDGRYDDIL
jgi:hypothetical protein